MKLLKKSIYNIKNKREKLNMIVITPPLINPVALSLGMINIYWYGLMYVFAFIFAFYMGKRNLKKYFHIKR